MQQLDRNPHKQAEEEITMEQVLNEVKAMSNSLSVRMSKQESDINNLRKLVERDSGAVQQQDARLMSPRSGNLGDNATRADDSDDRTDA